MAANSVYVLFLKASPEDVLLILVRGGERKREKKRGKKRVRERNTMRKTLIGCLI